MQLGLPEITEALAREIIAGAVLPLLGNLAPPLQYPGHAELVAAKDDGSRGGKSADSPGLSLNAAMALRAVAACVHSLRQVGLAGLAVPLAQLLLWPAAPAALVSAIQAPQSSAAPGARDHVTAAFAAASAAAVEEDLATLRAAEPLSEQQRSRRRLTGPGLLLDAEETCSGELSVFIPNPFRAAMLGMLHRAEGEDKDNRDRERQESLRGLCPGPLLAAWAFTELWAALGGISAMEEAQLLPVSARQEPLFPEGAGFADVLSAGLSWLWAGYAGALHGTGGSPGEADDEDVPGASQDGLEEEGHSGQKDGGVGPCLHTHMVASLRARSRLPRLGHEAVAAAILELASLSASESVLQRTAQESAAWLQEASGLLCGAAAAAEAACGSQGGDAHSGFSGLHARSLSADASAPWGSGMSGLPGPTGPPASAVPAGFPTNLDRLEAATAAAEQLITAFLEEWEWHQTKMRELQAVVPEESGSRLPVELMAEVCSNDECLLTPSRNGHTAPRDAARALLSLRRLCAALVLSGPEEDASSPLAQGAGAGAFGSSSAQGELFGSGAFGSVAPKEAAQDRGQGQSHACQMMDASSCPVQAEVGSETDRDGRHGRNQSTQSISCVGPAGEQWALLLHPSALIVSSQNGESSIHADKGPSEATLCVPLWRVSARPSASDPLLLRLRICHGPQTTRQPVQRIFSNNLVANGPDHPAGAASKARAAAARGERLLSLRFLNAPARTEAFGHVRERRSLELKRLLGQIATFARQATAAASEDVQRLSGSLGGRRRQRRREEDLSCQRVGPVVHRAGQGLCGRDDYSP
ncbi:unnamed protein product [Polarella glacialis]|nr:unnamed protein product [Polarella glacialis]